MVPFILRIKTGQPGQWPDLLYRTVASTGTRWQMCRGSCDGGGKGYFPCTCWNSVNQVSGPDSAYGLVAL